MDYNFKYNNYLEVFNKYLDQVLTSLDSCAPDIITNSMKYAVEGGGKRIRPVMCLAAAELLGVDFDRVKRYALAVELIHSYSLVHDDLPAMDNDDYRRGKLSTHKKFGEAYGILAGDALLNFAFELCLSEENFSPLDVNAMRILADYAGYKGMIAGQVLDLSNEKNNSVNENTLFDIYYNKTAKLIIAPLLIASILSGGRYYSELEEFGYNLGIMFQITDDIMDEEGQLESIGKTPHKDKETGKYTSIKVFGLDGAKDKAKQCYNNCIDILSLIPNSEFFKLFTQKMYDRKK